MPEKTLACVIGLLFIKGYNMVKDGVMFATFDTMLNHLFRYVFPKITSGTLVVFLSITAAHDCRLGYARLP